MGSSSGIGKVKSVRWRTAALLLVLLLTGWLMRWAKRSEPLEWDLTNHAVIGDEMLHGAVPYRDVWEIKPPGIMVTSAWAEVLAGYGENEVLLLNLAAFSLSFAGAYYAGKAFEGEKSGVVAALLWTFLSWNIRIQANQPNVEVCINATLFGILALMLSPGRANSAVRGVALGLLFALLVSYKQFLIVEALCLAIPYLWKVKREFGSATVYRSLAAIALGFVLVWGGIYLWLAPRGGWTGLWMTLTVVGKGYAGSPAHNLWSGLAKGLPFEPNLRDSRPLAVFILWSLLCPKIYQKWPYPFALLCGLLAGTWISVTAPGRFYPHYYQLWLPLLTLAGAAALCACFQTAQESTPGRRRTGGEVARIAAGAGVLLWMIGSNVDTALFSPESVSRKKYGETYIQHKKLALWLQSRLQPDARIYVWGMSSDIYFYSRHRPSSNVLDWMMTPRAENFLAQPYRAPFEKRWRADLAQHPPQLVILDSKDDLATPEVKWLLTNFVPLVPPFHVDRLLTFVRRPPDSGIPGGKLKTL